MELLYISGYQFLIEDGKCYSRPAYGVDFWEKYLSIFDKIHILGEPMRGNADKKNLLLIEDDRIEVQILPSNSAPGNFKVDRRIKNELKRIISDYNYIMIKMASRKGIMAIEEAKRQSKKYMIGMSGDLNLDLKSSDNIFKRIYSPIIYRQVKKAIKDCRFGIYVTTDYLQKQYPIEGETAGCTNTILKEIDLPCLNEKIERIRNKDESTGFKIGLIGTYSNNRKGIDTALEAISLCSDERLTLHILGIGVEADRERWYKYASKLSVSNQLYFDQPVKGVDNVFKWIDTMDIIILPSRSEGLPRCIIEAISRGAPCIISNVCGCPELVEEKWLHNPGDSRKLSELLNQMVNDKKTMEDTAIVNFGRARYYLYDEVAKRRTQIINRYIDYVKQG